MLWSQLEPSLVRKIGSSPRVRRNRNLISAAETDQPSPGRWQEEQERPFVPSDWKNGPVRSMAVLLILYVSTNPLRLGSGKRFGSGCAVAGVAASTIATSTAIEFGFTLASAFLVTGHDFEILTHLPPVDAGGSFFARQRWRVSAETELVDNSCARICW